jgi:hypothetical protein
MNTEPTTPPLDRALLQLRISLANTLTVTDMIRTLRPGGDHLLPHLYSELQTLLRVERRARAMLRRYITPPEGSAS